MSDESKPRPGQRGYPLTIAPQRRNNPHMAQTGQSKTVKMANGNRVTVTTGYNSGGYYRKTTVRRPDGTADSRTERKNAGVLNTGLLNLGGYGEGVPKWAGGTQSDFGWGSIIGFETGPFLSAAHALALGKELRMRGWSDNEIRERAAPHIPFRVI